MSEIFPDGTLDLLGKILGPLEDYMDGGSPDGPPRPDCVINAEVVIGQILADQVVHKSSTTDPQLTIAILESYLRAVYTLPLPGGGTVADLLLKDDEKLFVGVAGAVGDASAMGKIEAVWKDIRDRHGKSLDKLGET